ncbi:hypothetical protein EME01_11780 [Sinorhizobium meliloti]|nr:hypothetical protein EME01_11780 [Sinorhizobium meliloti]
MGEWRFVGDKPLELFGYVFGHIGPHPENISLGASCQPKAWPGRPLRIVLPFYPAAISQSK